MSHGDIALIISIASAGIALFALGWNIYRDVLLKPSLRVRLSIVYLLPRDDDTSPPKIDVSATNFGPGNVRLDGIRLKKKKLLRKKRFWVMFPSYIDPLSANFPCGLKVGERKTFLLKFDENCFLKEEFTHLGVIDTFGRIRWVPKRDIRGAKESYKKWFRENRATEQIEE